MAETGSVLRRAYVPVLPELDGFDRELLEKLRAQDPGSKAGKQIGGQLNRALKRLNLDPIDVKADPKQALAKIEETELRLKRLAAQSPTVEVKIKIDQGLSQLARFKKQLGDVGGEGGGEESAEKFAAGFSSRIGPLIAKAPVGPAMIAAAIAAAPVIGATISAAVIGGAGVGGVVGGLLLVKDDPRVQAAGKGLGEKLLGTLKGDAAPFVEPALAAAAKIESRFDAMNTRIQVIFSKSSGFLGPLVDGATKGVDEILRGVESLVTKGKPVIDALGGSFAIIGHSVGDALSVISGGSEESASALTNLAKATGVMIEAAGYLVRGLTEVYGVVTYLPGKFQELERYVGRQVGIQQDAGDASKQASVETYKMAAALLANADAAVAAARANGLFVATAADVQNQQKAVTAAQDNLNNSIASMAPAGTRAAQIAEGLRKSIQALTGAQVGATDANESYEASWDSLSESIKTNGTSLKIHSAAGRANRDALEAVATATRDAYVADINSGIAIGTATKKHDQRIAALKEEAKRNGLDRDETKKLVDTYGSIPKGRETKLVVRGTDDIVQALKDLYVFQRSLADGIPIASEIAKLKGEKGPAKKYGGYLSGGQLPGPPSTRDNLTGVGPDGKTFGLAGGEWIINPKQSRKHWRTLKAINEGDEGFAAGGYYPVEQRDFRVTTNASHTKIPTRSEVASKVYADFGNWPSSPSAQRGDSGVWRKVLALARSSGLPVNFGNGYRPGDPLWHGSGRADDLMGYNQDRLAQFFLERQPQILEMIHRTDKRDYAYTRGVNKGSFNETLMNAHRNHLHIAMDDGGMRVLQPGLNIIPNNTGRPEPIAGPTAMASMGGNTYQITVNVPPTAHPAEVGRQVITVIQAYEEGNGNRWRQGPP